MSIFGSILSAIFHRAKATTPDASATASATPAQTAATQSTPAATTPVDVNAVLNGLAEKNPQKLNWKESIVDLLKLLDLDSSLDARKKLASELGFTGDTSDSASMNIWLIKTVRQKLAENDGKLPAGL